MTRFSNKAYLQQVTARLVLELAAPIDQPEMWTAWRQTLRAKVAELLGGLPPQAQGAPQIEVLDHRDEDGYVREQVVMRSRDGVDIPAFLLTPTGSVPAGGTRRAVLCLHGHGHGKGDVVGDPGQGTSAERAEVAADIAAHNYDYARRLAQMGFVTLAPDARGFGERAEAVQDCYVPGVVSLFLGIPMAGQRLRDDMSALDYLSTLPGVDATRLGCVGLSEGGKRTLYLAAMDDRVKAAVVSGYFCTLKGAIRDWDKLENWDICNYVPGLLRYADYPDLAALLAPRPLLIENASDDPLYDQDAVREALDLTARAYAAQGAPDHFDVDIFTGGHRWSGRKSFAWMDRWL